jgi:hypothetical protein
MVNKEQLLYFFLTGKISLSGYDMKFMSNLQNMIHRDKKVTSNQAKLFDALIYKYKRQLTKNKLDTDDLKKLPWRSTVVESSPEFTGARVDCIDGMLNLRVPFNKKFIADFKTKENPFVWYKEEKMYKAKFSTGALKLLYNQLPKHFKSVIYSPALHSLIEEVEKYKNLIWEPTVVKVGNNYIIAGANEHLLKAVDHIDLSDLNNENDIQTAFELSRYQVKLSPSLLKERKDLEFASNFYAEVDIEDIDLVAKWLNTIKIKKFTIFNRKARQSKHQKQYDSLYNEIVDKFSNQDIEKIQNETDQEATVLVSLTSLSKKTYLYSILSNHTSKIIKINNSRPIEIS